MSFRLAARRVRITGGELRPEPDGDIAESVWTPFADVPGLRRSRHGPGGWADRAPMLIVR
jgi:hypothetical protein